MNELDVFAARRLRRLERVLAGRQARFASTMDRKKGSALISAPLNGLQRYGYSVALLLALAAVLPTVAGFVVARRELLLRATANHFGILKLRKRIDAAHPLRDDR